MPKGRPQDYKTKGATASAAGRARRPSAPTLGTGAQAPKPTTVRSKPSLPSQASPMARSRAMGQRGAVKRNTGRGRR